MNPSLDSKSINYNSNLIIMDTLYKYNNRLYESQKIGAMIWGEQSNRDDLCVIYVREFR